MSGAPTKSDVLTEGPDDVAPVDRVVLWRHGQTDDNVARRLQGQVDNPLNALGERQAAAAAKELALLLRRREAPVRIATSDLRRARATAQALGDELGIEVEVVEGLRERSFGPWERLTHEEIDAEWPEDFLAWRQGRDPDLEGFEGRRDCAERVGGTVDRLARECDEGTVLVAVAHGAALSLATVHLLGIDPAAWAGLRGMDNCHWAVLRPNPGRTPAWVLTDYNVGAVPDDIEVGEPAPDVAPGTGSAPGEEDDDRGGE